MRDLQKDLEWFNEVLGHCHAHGPVAEIAAEVLPEAIKRAIEAEGKLEQYRAVVEAANEYVSKKCNGCSYKLHCDLCDLYVFKRALNSYNVEKILAELEGVNP
ncbi:MAG: hypothetical protein GXY34_00195 [Syntrophomonadaceae bacterium]|nr:hypothetical protein [Syntrophomonadaceae bacterium]